jgi:hypothetical protein
MSKPAIIDHAIPTTREESERIVEIAKITPARLKYLNRAADILANKWTEHYIQNWEKSVNCLTYMVEINNKFMSGKNRIDDTFSEILKLCNGCTGKDLLCEAVYDIKCRLEA